MCTLLLFLISSLFDLSPLPPKSRVHAVRTLPKILKRRTSENGRWVKLYPTSVLHSFFPPWSNVIADCSVWPMQPNLHTHAFLLFWTCAHMEPLELVQRCCSLKLAGTSCVPERVDSHRRPLALLVRGPCPSAMTTTGYWNQVEHFCEQIDALHYTKKKEKKSSSTVERKRWFHDECKGSLLLDGKGQLIKIVRFSPRFSFSLSLRFPPPQNCIHPSPSCWGYDWGSNKSKLWGSSPSFSDWQGMHLSKICHESGWLR